MLMISAWCLKCAIADVSAGVLSISLSKCEAARKDTLTPNYTIIANLTADVKLFFKKPSAIGFRQRFVNVTTKKSFLQERSDDWKT